MWANGNKPPQITTIDDSNKIEKILGKIPKIQSLYNSINRPYATEDNVSNEFREKLKNDLKPEIDELSKLIGRDLSYWCQR